VTIRIVNQQVQYCDVGLPMDALPAEESIKWREGLIGGDDSA